MRFVVLTIFPGMFESYLACGIVGRGLTRGLAAVDFVDIRDYTTDRHRTVDDLPFGGGAGLVMKPEPLAQAIDAVGPVSRRVLLGPAGRTFKQSDAVAWSQMDTILLVCGRYEGVDERVSNQLIDDTVSVGDYVLSGGELAAMAVMDATIRLIPGVLGNDESIEHESFGNGLLEHPHYTRPAEWRGEAVPQVLLSGHHAEIDRWRRRESLRCTAERRPDLLAHAQLSPDEMKWLRESYPLVLANEE